MTISVLDRTDGRTGAASGNGLSNGLGGLHDAAGEVDENSCRAG